MKPSKAITSFGALAALTTFTLFMSFGHVQAASLAWDGNGNTAPNPAGGTGTWDVNTSLNFWDGTTNVVWPASGTSNDAVFDTTAGTVTLATGGVTAHNLAFNLTGYTLTGTTLTLNGATPTITTAAGVTATVNSVVAGSAGLTKAGVGTLTLGGTNTFTGGAVVSSGKLVLNSASAATASGTVTLGDANTGSDNVELDMGTTGGTWANPIIVSANGTGTAIIKSTYTVTHTFLTGGMTLNRPTTLFVATGGFIFDAGGGVITGSVGTLTIDGTGGKLQFDQVNTFTGDVVINSGGTLQLNGSNRIPDASNVMVNGVLTLVGTNETISGLNGSGQVQALSGGGNLTVGFGNANGTFTGSFIPNGSSGTFIKIGTGTQILSGANTYTNGTTISGGVLQLGNAGTTGSLSTSGITNNANLTINRTNAISQGTSFGTISGSGSFTQAGTGTTTFTAANTYSGPTVISAGTLALTGSGSIASSSSIDVQASGTLSATTLSIGSGKTLKGTGLVSAATTVASGGTVAPAGDGTIGTLNANGSLILAGTASFDINKTGATLTSDSIGGTASVTFGGALTVTATGDALVAGDSFTLFSNTGSRTGSFSGVPTLPPLNAGLTWNTSQLATNGTISVASLTVVSVPTFNPVGGGYQGAQSVTITSDSGSTIHYTTDGSDPLTSGTVATGASPVSGVVVPTNSTTVVKAYATKSGQTDSAVATSTYTTLSSPVWTNSLSGQSWPTASNWLSNVAPNGAGNTADFSTLTLTGNTTVHLDTSITISRMVFGDVGNTYGWTLDSGAGGSLTLDGATPTITVNNQTTTISAPLGGTLGFVKAGSGTLVLSGTSTLAGPIAINAGTLQLSGGSSLGSGGVVDNGALVLNQSAISIGGAITGTGSVSGTTAGTLAIGQSITLTNNNITLSSSGVGSLASGANLSVGTGTASISSNATSLIGFTIGGNNSLSATGGGSITLSGKTTTTGGGYSGLTFGGSNLTTSGTINLSGQNTGEWGVNFASNTTIHATTGTTTLTGTTTNGSSTKAPFLFFGNPTITLTADSGAAIVLQGGATTGGGNYVFYDYNGGSTFNVSGSVSFIAGATASGDVFWTNTSTLFTVGANSALTLDAGGLPVGHGARVGSMGANSSVTYASSSTGGTMTGGQVLTASTDSLIYNISGSGTLTQSGVISGAGSLSKTGSGFLTLSVANTYTGPTTVTGGVLRISGSLSSSSAVAVASTATLSGTGTAAGPVTVDSGGFVTPGGSGIGTLSLGASTLNGTYTCQIDGAGADQIAVTGNLTFGGSAAIAVTQTNPATAASYTIATYTGTLTGAPTVTGIPSGYQLDTSTAGQIKLVQVLGYNTWIAGFPGLSDTTPQGDPDHDGIPNIIEFLTNGDPSVSSEANLPTISASGDSLVFTFVLRDDAAYLNPTVEFSTSLDSGTWTTAVDGSNGVTIDSTNNGDGATHTIIVTIPKGSETKLFARLKVAIP